MATDDYAKIEHDMAAMLRESFPVTWPPGLATKLSLHRVGMSCVSAIKTLSSSWKQQETGVRNGIDLLRKGKLFCRWSLASIITHPKRSRIFQVNEVCQ